MPRTMPIVLSRGVQIACGSTPSTFSTVPTLRNVRRAAVANSSALQMPGALY